MDLKLFDRFERIDECANKIDGIISCASVAATGGLNSEALGQTLIVCSDLLEELMCEVDCLRSEINKKPEPIEEVSLELQPVEPKPVKVKPVEDVKVEKEPKKGAKNTKYDIPKIQALLNAGWATKDIAVEFGVDTQKMSKVIYAHKRKGNLK